MFWSKYATDLKTCRTRQIIAPSSSDYLVHGVDPKGGRVWIGVNDWPFQLFRYDLETGKSTELKLPAAAFPNRNDEIRQVHYSPTTGTLFLAILMEGVLELDLDGTMLNHYDDNNSPVQLWHANALYGLHEDEAGQLWVAHGAEAGLSKMDLKTRKIPQYHVYRPAQKGLPDFAGQERLPLVVERKGHLAIRQKKRGTDPISHVSRPVRHGHPTAVWPCG